MNARFHDRLAAFVSIALLGLLGGFTYLLSQWSERYDRLQISRTVTHDPDYFVERFAVTRLDEQGSPRFRVTAERMRHYPDTDASEFEQPVLASLDPGKPRLILSARRGEADSDALRLQLRGEVLVRRESADGRPPLRVETDSLEVLREAQLARTDEAVRIVQGASSLTGVGMEFDNSTGSLRLDSRVRGVWAPSSAR